MSNNTANETDAILAELLKKCEDGGFDATGYRYDYDTNEEEEITTFNYTYFMDYLKEHYELRRLK